MSVLDTHCSQRLRQGFLVELGIMPRTRYRSYIEQVCNFVFFQQIDEFIKRMGGMSDGAYQGLYTGGIFHAVRGGFHRSAKNPVYSRPRTGKARSGIKSGLSGPV